MAFETFLNELPLIHSWDGGVTWNSGGFSRQHLEAIYEFLRPRLGSNPSFLETGAGLSTITLLYLEPSRLISIAPEPDLFDRIRSFCSKTGVPLLALEDHADGSQWVLPSLAAANRLEEPFLDFVLIDGCHGWPTAFVDLEYSNAMLKNGGYLMIDDVQLHSLKEMALLISGHPAFSLTLDLGKALVFQKILPDRHLGEWCDQPYIVRQTDAHAKRPNQFALQPPSLPSKVQHAIRRLPQHLANRLFKREDPAT